MGYRYGSHSLYDLKYHIVFCTKYRYRILTGKVMEISVTLPLYFVFASFLYFNPTIDIKIINPGFVKTDLMAKNNFDMPMMITAEKAAIFIADGLLGKNFEIYFLKKLLSLKLIQFLPYGLSIKLTAQLNDRKKS